MMRELRKDMRRWREEMKGEMRGWKDEMKEEMKEKEKDGSRKRRK